MIPISEVLEEAAQTVEGFDACDPKHIAEAIRALIPKYEGCIVAEGPAIAPELLVPLYRAKEPK